VSASLELKQVQAVGRTGFFLEPISFRVDAGAPLAIVGAAGAGKSHLLALIAGLARVMSGSIEKPARVSMVFQRDALDDARTAFDNVATAAKARGVHDPESSARTALDRVGLANDVDKLPRALSGGMRKRVGIARALAVDPELVLADDPTAGLDPATAGEILALLVGKDADHRVTIIATQDVDVVLPHVAHVLVLEQGRAIFSGAPSALVDAVEGARAFAARAPLDHARVPQVTT
jgi:ABC-type transporter Mla maintaining outer membrane lipid asymmetry ATPase subunit MlaF